MTGGLPMTERGPQHIERILIDQVLQCDVRVVLIDQITQSRYPRRSQRRGLRNGCGEQVCTQSLFGVGSVEFCHWSGAHDA